MRVKDCIDMVVAFTLLCATLLIVFLLAFRWPITIIVAALIIASAM